MNQLQDDIVAVLDSIFAYGIDWTEFKDKSENDHSVSMFAGKIKSELKDELTKTLTELIAKRVVAELERITVCEYDGEQPARIYITVGDKDWELHHYIKQLSSTKKGKL